MISTIVCADKNWGIGYQGDLLVKIPEDMKLFKELTDGQTVVMGRKTYDSLPKKPLANRENVIITNNYIPDEFGTQINEDGSILNKMERVKKVFDFINKCDSSVKIREMFVIGGGQVYKELLPYCKKAYVTEVDHEFENVDTYFPNLDEMPNWWLIESSQSNEHNGMKYRFKVYEQVDYDIVNVTSDYENNEDIIEIRFKNSDVTHNIVIKYYFHGSKSIKLKTFTVPALCHEKNLEKFMVRVQLYKQNKDKVLNV